MALNQPLSYIASVQVTNFQGVLTRPFGYPYAKTKAGGADEAPKKLSAIASPSLSWLMTDADQGNASSLGMYYALLPKQPAHGKVRNQLFFDWHVAAVKAGN